MARQGQREGPPDTTGLPGKKAELEADQLSRPEVLNHQQLCPLRTLGNIWVHF